MQKQTISKLTKNFEDFVHTEDDIEFWYARDLQNLLGYSKWENFSNVLEKANISCNKSGFLTSDHFPGIRKMVQIGSGAKKEIEDYKLTRYACYLVGVSSDLHYYSELYSLNLFKASDGNNRASLDESSGTTSSQSGVPSPSLSGSSCHILSNEL